MLRRRGTPRNRRLAYAAARMASDGAGQQRSASESGVRLQAVVFCLVAASFTAVYITQPVLPVLQVEFGISEAKASLTVSAVILGIALANLPFGVLSDRYPIRPSLLGGATVVSAASLLCAATKGIWLLIAARFVQGLFIPSLTTCLAAYLARSLPLDRLNVVMGSYVSATIAGGLGGRLLGGWIHPPLHWRYAFVTSAVLLVAAATAAARALREPAGSVDATQQGTGFVQLLSRPEVLRVLAVSFSAFFVFSATFNYLPFYVSRPPINAPLNVVTLLYLAYVVGMVAGPLAGKLSNRLGSGPTMILGSAVLAIAIACTLVASLKIIAPSLAFICAGFFGVHAAALGTLNRRLTGSRGRANSLYVLFYYLGGAAGISSTGWAYSHAGWQGVVGLAISVLTIPLGVGLYERAAQKRGA
jgi:YNFM family putative membrane transporter